VISVIVVSYNTREMTLACLASVYEYATGGLNLIVIDNNSSDGSADAVASRFPGVALIRLSENLGFSRANNLATQSAVGDYLLLLNPDTVVLDGAIDKLLAFAESCAGEHIWGGRTFNAKRELDKSSCWGKPTPWSFFCYGNGLTSLFRNSSQFNPEAYGDWQRDSVRNVDIVSGCFLLIKKSLWDSLGGFDPKFFMYGEDADLCLRAKKLGVQPIIFPDATIIHYGGASENIRADKMVRLFKAKMELIKRHWNPAWVPFGIFMYKWAALSRYLVCSALALVKSRYRESAKAWREIWQRRNEWEIGYP
jgi:GT2 family glycosyltransferase